jgi:hypothetical protein
MIYGFRSRLFYAGLRDASRFRSEAKRQRTIAESENRVNAVYRRDTANR